jgi:hypothetical protein
MWEYGHSVLTTATPDALWRHWSDVAAWPEWNQGIAEITGPAAGQVGPQLGPAITADFPDVLAGLVTRAEG